ncbi:MAG: hypothetical protein K2N73_10530 [Lachnospiraceae bacterium]|nr:hypothetical protein [Lachnospiraceae bacterium]
MAEIKEMNLEAENSKIEELKASNDVIITRVVFDNGSCIYVSGNDASIIMRFLKAGDELEDLGKEEDKIKDEYGENDYEEAIEIRMNISKRASEIMDGVFGEGTTDKYFGDVLRLIPTFIPDVECFLGYWDSFIPLIERMMGHKEKLASKKRMAKYQPQDHKRKGAK